MERKAIVVTYGETVQKFERIFISGKVIEDVGQVTTMVYGYEDFRHFSNDFIVLVQTGYQFLKSSTDYTKEEILETMQEIFDQAIEDVKNEGMNDRLRSHETIILEE